MNPYWNRLRCSVPVFVLIAAYIVYFGALTVQKHNAFQSTAFDLGNVDQAVWNTRHGRPFAMTNIEGLSNRLGTHVEPILLPISLLYFIWSDPRALLLLQTVVLALGAWPLFLLAKRQLSRASEGESAGERVSASSTLVLALVLALAYLLFPTLQSANVFDFHAVSLAPTFFLFAFYCLETERWTGYALFAVLTMSCKEDMPLLVAILGLYAIVIRRQWVAGLVTVFVAGSWFLLAVGWIIPRFDTQGASPLANRYAYLGDSALEMTTTLITRPGIVLDQLRAADALSYLFNLLVPVAFVSVLAPQVLVLAVPTLAVNLLSTDGFMHELEGFHYGVILASIAVISAAYGAAWLVRRFARFRLLPFLLAAAVLTGTLLYHWGHGYTPLAAGFSRWWPVVTEHHRLGEELAHAIPGDASLAALPRPNPHASQRQQLSMIDRVEDGIPAPLRKADYVWLDVTDSWPLHPNDLKAGVEKLLDGAYGIDQAVDGWLLLRQGASENVLPPAFYDFARSRDPQPQYPMHLRFLLEGEPVLECFGFDLTWQAEEVQSTFYWRALRPLPPGLRLYPFYIDDASGQILEDTTLRPLVAALWYPPERWPVGETVKTSTLPWEVGSTFSVGLGVVQGERWERLDHRLPIRVESSAQVVRLFDGDTWARLLAVKDGEPIEEQRVYAQPSPQHPLEADLAGQILFLGHDLDCDKQQRVCNLQLYWQAQRRLGTSYTVFAQFLDADGAVRAQVDSVPQQGGYPTIWWLPGEVVADSHVLKLPADAPQGASYRLIVGLYDSETGARLPVSGTDRDFVPLQP